MPNWLYSRQFKSAIIVVSLVIGFAVFSGKLQWRATSDASALVPILIQQGEQRLVVRPDGRTDTVSPDQRVRLRNDSFEIIQQDQELLSRNIKTGAVERIAYQLKQSGTLYEELAGSIESLNGAEAIVLIATYDTRDPESEFDGSRPQHSIADYRYVRATQSFEPTELLHTAYAATDQANPNRSFYGFRFVAWDSDTGRLYGWKARFGEGGDGALELFAVVDTVKQEAVARLQPVSDPEITIETPMLFPAQRKLVTVRTRRLSDVGAGVDTLLVYDMDRPEQPMFSLPIASEAGYFSPDPLSLTDDGLGLFLEARTRAYPTQFKGLYVDLSSKTIDTVYAGDVVRSAPLLSPDGRLVVFTRLPDSESSEQYQLVVLDRTTRQERVVFKSDQSFSILGFAQ